MLNRYVFLNNVAPEYSSWAEWASSAMKKISSGDESAAVKIVGRKKLTIKSHKSLGVLITSVNQANNSVKNAKLYPNSKKIKITPSGETKKTARLSCYDL